MENNNFEGKIYKIINIINNKIYIGQTIQTLKERWGHHIKKSAKECFFLKRAFNKYGVNNFNIEQIDSASCKTDLDNKEIYWIAYYRSNSREFGYNYNSGGGGNTGYRHTDESKKKISIAVLSNHPTRGKKLSEETKKKMSISAIGKKLSEETKLKLSEINKGSNNPNFGRSKTSLFMEKLSERNSLVKIKVQCIETREIYNSITECANKLNLQPSKVSLVVNGKRNKTGGYSFKKV